MWDGFYCFLIEFFSVSVVVEGERDGLSLFVAFDFSLFDGERDEGQGVIASAVLQGSTG